MAANSGDLVQTLIEGGLAPQAARTIANALANAASPAFSKGGDTDDATPIKQLRLITSESRRYQLTNLDYSPSKPFQDRLSSNPGEYAGPSPDHPYKDSQPVTSAPPLSAPRVQANDYITVENEIESNSAVSRIGLRLRQATGKHLRIDPSTKFLDALPFLAETESPRFLSSEITETELGTQITVSLRNLEAVDVELADGKTQQVFVFPDAAPQTPSYGAASAKVRAMVVFNPNSTQVVNGETRANIVKQANVSKVLKVVDGAFDVYFASPMPDSAYGAVVTASDNESGENAEKLTFSAIDSEVLNINGFRVRFWTPTQVSLSTPVNPIRAVVAVLA